MSRRLPRFDAQRCVHALAADASCSNCVAACPQAAIVLDDDGLGLVEGDCDGCGVCVSVCPMRAIELARGEARVSGEPRDRTAFVACSRSGPQARRSTEPEAGRVSCIHAVGLRDLSGLYRSGVRRLVVRNACDDCGSGAAHREACETGLSRTCEQFNRLMRSRGLDTVRLDLLSPDRWDRIAEASCGSDSPRKPSRRALFARLLPDGGNGRSDRFRLDPDDNRGLPGDVDDALHAFVPDVDLSKCTGCDACCRICPTGALSLINTDSSHLRYSMEANRCTGCMLCADVCDTDAVFVRPMCVQRRSSVVLQSAVCRACGAEYHQPASVASENGLCRICRGKNHAATLFQVLE